MFILFFYNWLTNDLGFSNQLTPGEGKNVVAVGFLSGKSV
jgi:hypothetical protein